MTEYDPYTIDDFMMGKKGGKKGRHAHWLEAQAWQKGKGVSNRFKGKGPTLDHQSMPTTLKSSLVAWNSRTMKLNLPGPGSTLPATHGLLDCGATAGPQLAVENLISSMLAKDSKAVIQAGKDDGRHVRFGNGKWGGALYGDPIHLMCMTPHFARRRWCRSWLGWIICQVNVTHDH